MTTMETNVQRNIRILEKWHEVFDARLEISYGDYEHAREQANYYAERESWETLEEHQEMCTCICDPFGGGMCDHCMDDCNLNGRQSY